MKNVKTVACNLPPGAFGRKRLDKTSTYKVDGKVFVVKPVFRTEGHETLGTILVRLMQTDSDD